MTNESGNFEHSKDHSLELLEGAYSLIEFYKVEDEDSIDYVIENLDSKKAGHGKAAVKAFVNHVGSGKKVRASIIEEESFSQLAKLRVLLQVRDEKAPVVLTDQSVLMTIKIVRVLAGGGMKIESLVVSPKSEAEVAESELSGLVKFFEVKVFAET